VGQLKSEIADVTGCTVLIVDHMPWATETNRGRLRSYGGVFKNAATRFGIYIDVQNEKVVIEARGKNIRGFRRTPAVWDSDRLEYRLEGTKTGKKSDEELEQAVLDFFDTHDWTVTEQVKTGVEGRNADVLEAMVRLEKAGRLVTRSSAQLGRPGTGKYWNHADSAAMELVPDDGTSQDDPPSGVTSRPEVVPSSHPP